MVASSFGRKNFFGDERGDFLSIDPQDFNTMNINTMTVTYNGFDATSSSNGVYLHAPVHLPNNCTITSAIGYGLNNTGNARWQIFRSPLNLGSASAITLAQNLGSVKLPYRYATIDNENYTYYFRFKLDNGDKVYGGRIDYKRSDV